MRKVFNFGKIAYASERKINEVTLEMEYRDGRFCVCGDVWNGRHTDIVCGGQCLDELLPYFKDNELFMTIYRLWDNYHLNDLHAGTKEQEEAIHEHFGKHKYIDYNERVEYLKSVNLYEVPYNGEMYKYGSGWISHSIPKEDIEVIKELLTK